MAVTVTTNSDHTTVHEDASKWHIDDERQLHVVDSQGKHVAAYGTNVWASVSK